MVHPRPREKKEERRPPSLLSDILLFFGAAASFATLFSIFGPTLYIVDQHHAASSDLRAPRPRTPDLVAVPAKPQDTELGIEADVEDLVHEEQFQATIKSCLPAEQKNCKEFVAEPVGGKKRVQRVALIAPPGDISGSLVGRVEDIVRSHNTLANKSDLEIELIETTHVPPYGYGKTHGLTKALRLIPQPLVLEVTDALQALLEPGETDAIITLADVKAGLRQIIRFHCRLSHLAAHTSIMSVGFMEILNGPGATKKKLSAFLLPNETPKLSETVQTDDLQFTPDDDQEGLFEAKEVTGTNILSHIQSTYKVDVNAVLDAVLLEELMSTKNLTAWPCQSFWTTGDGSDPTILSPLTQRLARALSPDCDDPLANCWVERDKCEAEGDGLCLRDKKR